jgi:hypothetical protein
MNSSAAEVRDVAQDGGAVADMHQRVATILADGGNRCRSLRLGLPGNLGAGTSRRHVACIERRFLARSGT